MRSAVDKKNPFSSVLPIKTYKSFIKKRVWEFWSEETEHLILDLIFRYIQVEHVYFYSQIKNALVHILYIHSNVAIISFK